MEPFKPLELELLSDDLMLPIGVDMEGEMRSDGGLEKLCKKTGLPCDLLMLGIERARERKSFFMRSLHERDRIKASFTSEEKLHLYRGMLLTRALDNALKKMFLSGGILYQNRPFQGKGFRSLGQEAIFGAPLRLRHGQDLMKDDGYHGDMAGPLIRDLGVFLAMSDNDVEAVLNAQAGKEGPPSSGRDLHLGDLSKGLLMPAAPLAISTCTMVGLALAAKLRGQDRVHLSFIGEGGSSLGEWHEAINLAAVLSLPMIFCIENNRIALSTRASQQSRLHFFADKAIGYGINSLCIDGNDIEAVASAFAFAADEARRGSGPVLIELVTMRMCGHAHHDDMIYLGKEPPLKLSMEPTHEGGLVDRDLYERYLGLCPLARYGKKLTDEGLLSAADVARYEEEAISRIDEALKRVKGRRWPQLSSSDDELVFKRPWVFVKGRKQELIKPAFHSDGQTYLKAIAEGVKRCFMLYDNCLVVGEDVAPPYGNAFMMFKDFPKEFDDRFINTPISENAIIGACVGMAMDGLLPIGELQFNDFVASGFDQMVNNAAKSFFRSSINLPMVVRMPYGGLRRAGPYHSQDTSPWFFRTPGLKIMAPSTPDDAMHMLIEAVADPDPVLFYEHIALYRDPSIKERLGDGARVEGAALRRLGPELTIISYGAFCRKAEGLADELLARHGWGADVIDLRYLMPIDFDAICDSVKKTSRVLLMGEDHKRGGILQSIASRIAEELFFELDAPVVVLGSRDIPVPYAPSLEDDFLLSDGEAMEAAIELIRF